jgi:hypothetical protein
MKKLAVVVLLGVAVACSSGGGGTSERQGNTEVTEQVPVAAEGAPAQTAACGIERWAVKTGTDSGAAKVAQTPVPATVAKLDALTAPKNPTARVAPTEDTTYQVSPPSRSTRPKPTATTTSSCRAARRR